MAILFDITRKASRRNARIRRHVDSDSGHQVVKQQQQHHHHHHVTEQEILTYFDYETQPPIEIKQSCFLIPIFFAVWWYWTRRAARRALRVLTAGGEGCCRRDVEESSASSSRFANEGEDIENRVPTNVTYDKFNTLDEVLAQESSSRHLVRWIGTTTDRTLVTRSRRIIKPVKQNIMHRPPVPNSVPVNTPEENQSQPYCEGLLSFDDALSTSTCNHWECIDNTVLEVGPDSPADYSLHNNDINA